MTDKTNGDGLAKSIETIKGKIQAGNGTADIDIQKADYEAVQTAVDKITTAITDTLEVGGLTELDTANLKTLKTAVENVGKTFASIGEIKDDGGTKYKVLAKDIDKAKEAMESLGKDLTEASTFAQNSSTASQNQPEIMLRVFYRLKNTNSIILRHITILVVSFVCGLKNTNSVLMQWLDNTNSVKAVNF